MLKRNTGLEILDLRNNRLSKVGITAIAESLQVSEQEIHACTCASAGSCSALHKRCPWLSCTNAAGFQCCWNRLPACLFSGRLSCMEFTVWQPWHEGVSSAT